MKQPVIIAAKRIAFGKYGGRLRHLEPESLLEPLFNHFTDQYPKVMSLLDDVILGNTVGNGGNLARKSLLEAGLDFKIPGITIDRQCGSGLEAVIQACRMVQSGAGTIYILQVVLRVPVEHLGKSNVRSQFMNLSFHNFLNGRLLQEKEKTLQ